MIIKSGFYLTDLGMRILIVMRILPTACANLKCVMPVFIGLLKLYMTGFFMVRGRVFKWRNTILIWDNLR